MIMDYKEISVWSLITNNEFEKACEKADEEYRDSGNIFPLRNKVYALFHLKKYDEIISISRKCIEARNGESSGDFISLGIANWILGNVPNAIGIWKQAQNCPYKDAAGGIDTQVFLYFAAVKTHDDKLKLNTKRTIKKLLKTKRAINYPGPLGHYLLDDIDERQLVSYVANVPILRERQLCQAHFVSAIKSLEGGSIERYYRMLKACINHGSSSYLEQMYYLAKIELENKPQITNSGLLS